MLDYLANVELAYDEESNQIIAPPFRHDIFRTADIAEEVARFYGYDNIPTTLPKGEATTGKLQFHHRVENVAKDIAEFCGFSQGMNYSFESPKVFDKLLIPEDSVLRQAIRISNPLGDDFSIMRTTSLNGMLSSLGYNYSHRNKDVRLYELANIYLPKALPLTELPDERMQLTLGMYGDGDFFTMKGTDNITISVDGKEMDCDVKITNPSLRYTTIVTYKGAKRKMPVEKLFSVA